jgi:hypothetical protein
MRRAPHVSAPPRSSALMHAAHMALLVGLWRSPPGPAPADKAKAD